MLVHRYVSELSAPIKGFCDLIQVEIGIFALSDFTCPVNWKNNVDNTWQRYTLSKYTVLRYCLHTNTYLWIYTNAQILMYNTTFTCCLNNTLLYHSNYIKLTFFLSLSINYYFQSKQHHLQPRLVISGHMGISLLLIIKYLFPVYKHLNTEWLLTLKMSDILTACT